MMNHRSILRLPAICLLLATLLFLPACLDFKTRELTGSGMDMFAPAAMRIHPLSRLAPPPSTSPSTPASLPATAKLEVRIELTDQMGDVGKGVGTLYFELNEYSLIAPAHKGARLALWNADLSTPQLNQQHWDPITRTYLFNLALPGPTTITLNSKYVLSATMVFQNQTRLHDDYTLSGTEITPR